MLEDSRTGDCNTRKSVIVFECRGNTSFPRSEEELCNDRMDGEPAGRHQGQAVHTHVSFNTHAHTYTCTAKKTLFTTSPTVDRQ